jgi:hypothetical protein
MIKWGILFSMHIYAKVGKDEEGPVENVYRLVGIHKIVQVKGKFDKSDVGLKSVCRA